MANFFKKHFLSLSVIIALSLWSLWPILKDPARRTVDMGDGVLMAWYLNQTIQKIPGNLNRIFQGNIFYAYKNTMAYADMFILSAFTSLLPVKIFNEPLVAISSTLLFGQTATIFVLYLWFYDITKSKISSLLASVFLGFSLVRMFFIAHLQMWNMQWFLFASYMYFRFLKTNKILNGLLAFLFLGLQMWESPLGVYFGFALFILISVFNIRDFRKNLKTILLFTVLFVAVIYLPVSAYVSVSREFNYTRTIRDSAHFSLGVDELGKTVIFQPFFIIFFLSFLFLYTVSFHIDKYGKDSISGNVLTNTFKLLRKRMKEFRELFWAITIIFIGAVMALGPVLKWAGKTVKIFGEIPIPLPYSVLYYVIPGFKAFRTPARWVWFVILGMSFVIAIALAKFSKDKKIPHNFKILIVIIIIFITLVNARVKNYFVFQSTGEYPKVYSALKNELSGVLLELPAYTWAWGKIVAIESQRMVYSLYHGKYLLGGASGFNPPSWDEILNDSWNGFPSTDFESKLRSIGVRYILVWKNLYGNEKLEEIKKWGGDFVIYEDENHILFNLERSR